MIHRNKNSRSLDCIGKRRYGFNFPLERDIYCYLCCVRMKKKYIKKLDTNLKFNSYCEWKQYVNNKYTNFNNEELIEFSRYLNQMSRNIKPGKEYWNLFIPVIMTIIIAKIFEIIWNRAFNSPDISLLIVAINSIILTFVVTSIMYFLVLQTFMPLWNESIRENMIKDYKEIIDEMIKK